MTFVKFATVSRIFFHLSRKYEAKALAAAVGLLYEISHAANRKRLVLAGALAPARPLALLSIAVGMCFCDSSDMLHIPRRNQAAPHALHQIGVRQKLRARLRAEIGKPSVERSGAFGVGRGFG